jgi:DUF1680 family protein
MRCNHWTDMRTHANDDIDKRAGCRGVTRLLVFSILFSFLWFSLADAAPLEPVRLDHIKLHGFWKDQAKRITEKWLPHCVRQMEAGGRGQELLNLVATARLNRGEDPDWTYTGAPWSDAYVYNTVEAICLSLAVDSVGDEALSEAQNFLRAKLEEWIPIILAAQSQDGYIHSFHVLNQHERYSNVSWHEFYVMGYFLEMGVAHYRMTDGEDRRLFDAAVKCADHLCATFGSPPKRTWKNGHAGLEYALCRLGRLVNEVDGGQSGDKYIALAKYFLDHQHEGPHSNAYNQSDMPAIQMRDASGHAVRATYFYTAMADMAAIETEENGPYRQAVDRLWESAIERKHYITGGVGASHQGEAFDADYLLPNDGYCESCAGCGLSFWSDRMHRLHGDAHYRDVQERVLYNNILGALELTGENFFYQNPLESDAARYPWHGCPCCVGNIPRTLLGIKDAMFSTNPAGDALYLSHFVDCDVTISDLGGTSVRIRQKTSYPWGGKASLTLHPKQPATFSVHVRIPNRTESSLYTAAPDLGSSYELRVNGKKQTSAAERGYAAVTRRWKDGDRIELTLPMEIQRVRCDARVRSNRGRVALQRGPLVYNVEDIDHDQPAADLVLPPSAPLTSNFAGDLLGGVMVIEAPGFLAIPNYARLNRGGASQVWIVEQPDQVETVLHPPPENLPGFDAIKARTVDFVAIGDRKSEREHQLNGLKTSNGFAFGHPWRHAADGGEFSFRMNLPTEGNAAVYCTYWGSDLGNRRFSVLVDGKRIGSQVLDSPQPGKFFGVEYPIPQELVQGKKEVTVKLQAEPGATAGGIFDLRILKLDERE